MILEKGINRRHEENILELISSFGKDKEREIRTKYNSLREEIEREATVKIYIPTILPRIIKEEFEKKYGH